jgi:hypothetical protein
MTSRCKSIRPDDRPTNSISASRPSSENKIAGPTMPTIMTSSVLRRQCMRDSNLAMAPNCASCIFIDPPL